MRKTSGLREEALLRCDQCPEPKVERDDNLVLGNGMRLKFLSRHCCAPTPSCTLMAQALLSSESVEVGDQIIKWLTDQPDLRAIGVSSLATPNPRAPGLILTYPVPTAGRVIDALGGLQRAENEGS